MKDLLNDLFSDSFKIYRGGKIVDINNSESKQLDIVLTAKNTIKLYGDKGIYPIESVFVVFSITANLTYEKLHDCLEEFKSIPKNNPQIEFYGGLNESATLNKWKERFPYKCIFGFTGDINQNWEDELNKMVMENEKIKG